MPNRRLVNESLTFSYDKVGDILYIDKCAPYKEQDSEEIDEDGSVRLNPETDEVENVEILFFSRRLFAEESIEIPLSAELRLLS